MAKLGHHALLPQTYYQGAGLEVWKQDLNQNSDMGCQHYSWECNSLNHNTSNPSPNPHNILYIQLFSHAYSCTWKSLWLCSKSVNLYINSIPLMPLLKDLWISTVCPIFRQENLDQVDSGSDSFNLFFTPYMVTMARTEPSWSQDPWVRSFFQDLQMGTGPKHSDYTLLCSQVISREMDWKWLS